MFKSYINNVVTSVCLAGAVMLAGCANWGSTSGVVTSDRHASATAAKPVPHSPRKLSAPVSPRAGVHSHRDLIAYPTGDLETSVISVERVVAKQVRLNQPFSYELKVANLTGHTLTEVQVSDALSSNLKITSAVPEGDLSRKSFAKWSLGSLGPNESKTINIKAVATGKNVATSCASVSYSALLCTSISIVEPELQLTKVGPAEVLLCDDIVYRFSVANSGSGAIEDVQIKDTLPDGITTKDGKQSVAIAVGSLAPGQSRLYTVQTKASRRGRFVNKATAAGGGDVSAISGEVVTMVREPVLAITKTGPANRFIGRNATYEITVTNTGDGVARDTIVEDTVTSPARFVSASDGGQWAGGKVRWNIGSLQPKASKKVLVTTHAELAGTVRNTASANAYCAGRVVASSQTEYRGIPAILLEVVDVQDPIEVGENVSYVITATNQGTAPGTNIRIVCNLERNVQPVSSTGATRGSARNQVVTFDPLPSLAPRQKATWTVVVRAAEAGDVRFKVSMNSDQLSRPVEESEATNLFDYD